MRRKEIIVVWIPEKVIVRILRIGNQRPLNLWTWETISNFFCPTPYHCGTFQMSDIIERTGAHWILCVQDEIQFQLKEGICCA